jgi:type I restriction enzyme S subunit
MSGNGQLPGHWRYVRLDELGQLVSGGTPDKERAEYWTGTIPWASPKDMKQSRLTDTQDHITQEALDDGSRLIPAGSILIVIRGMILAKDVPVALAEVPMAFNQDMKALIPRRDTSPDFLLFAMMARKDQLSHFIGSTAHGTKRIGTESLAAWQVPWPPLAEQRAIARALRAVQAAREARRREAALERERKAALMQHLFTHGTRGEPTKPTEIGEMPESWPVHPLGELLRQRLRNGHSAVATNNETGVRTLTLTAVTQNDFSIENTKLTEADPVKVDDLWLRSGDILIERANTPEYVGLAALYEGPSNFAIFPDLMVRVRVDEARLIPRFLVEYLLTDSCRSYFRRNAAQTAGNFPKIDHATISAVPVPVPSLEVQQVVAGIALACDARISALDHEAAVLDELFRALLDELMTGRLSAVPLIESAAGGDT